MKTLLSTTAIVLGLGLPLPMLAQTAADAPATTGTTTGTANVAETDMPGFLSNRSPSDIFTSELMGHDVYARRTPDASQGQSATGTNGTGDLTMMNRADLDTMDNIGQINEIVLSADGAVRALVIGVGGFLGMGEQDVAVTMDQITFASDADDSGEMYVIVNTGADMLKSSPAYRRDAMRDAGPTGAMAGNDAGANAQSGTQSQTDTGAAGTDRTAFVAPAMQRDGYDQLPVAEVSAEMLMGKEVYGVNDDSVGTIDDLLLDDAGAISNVIIDFGGFLGMGTSQVSVGYEELTVLADGGRADVRIYIDATKEQIQAQPQYRAAN